MTDTPKKTTRLVCGKLVVPQICLYVSKYADFTPRLARLIKKAGGRYTAIRGHAYIRYIYLPFTTGNVGLIEELCQTLQPQTMLALKSYSGTIRDHDLQAWVVTHYPKNFPGYEGEAGMSYVYGFMRAVEKAFDSWIERTAEAAVERS